MRESIRFIHTADWQIGKLYRQVGDEQKRFNLQQERLNAIGRIRDAARMQSAAFVVVAGDLFDSPTPPTTALLKVLEAIGEMEIPVLVIPGNHVHRALGTVWHRGDFQRHQRQMAPNLRLLLEREPLELNQAVLLPCPLLCNQESSNPMTAQPAEQPWAGCSGGITRSPIKPLWLECPTARCTTTTLSLRNKNHILVSTPKSCVTSCVDFIC